MTDLQLCGSNLKEFIVKIIKDIGIVIEGTVYITAKSKAAAKELIKINYPDYKILTIKKK